MGLASKLIFMLSVAAMGLFLAYASLSMLTRHHTVQAFHPLYAGQCIMLDHVASWEVKATYKIEMVGAQGYLVRRIPENLWKTSLGFTIPFGTKLTTVECPERS